MKTRMMVALAFAECCPSITGCNLLIDAGRLCVSRGSTAGFLEAGKKK